MCNPDQSDGTFGFQKTWWNTSIRPHNWKIWRVSLITYFRERTDPNIHHDSVREHWWDDRIQKFRNVPQQAEIIIVTAIRVLAPLGSSTFQRIDNTTTVDTEPKQKATLD